MSLSLVNNVVTNTTEVTEYQKDLIQYSINKIWAMPEFKAKHFVGNAQITPYAEVKQYFIELSSREDLVESLEYDYRKACIELEIEQEKLKSCSNEYDKKLQELEIEKAGRFVKKKANTLEAAYGERKLFLTLIENFNSSQRGKLSDGRLLVEAIKDDSELVEKLEKEYWTLRLAKQTAMDMVAYGRAGVGNMDAVSMLSKEQQEEVMEIACDYFVRNEIRTQTMLSMANERVKLGHDGGELSKQLGLEIKAREDVYYIQSSQ
jgi:hypothetical protein